MHTSNACTYEQDADILLYVVVALIVKGSRLELSSVGPSRANFDELWFASIILDKGLLRFGFAVVCGLMSRMQACLPGRIAADALHAAV